jgi:6-phosphogluconolactonase
MTERLVADQPARGAAERIAAAVEAHRHVALAGGSTPRAAYELLAGMDLDWSGCTLWFGDERCVGPADERSNYAMVKDVLLDRLEGSRPEVRRIPGELGPFAGAEAYERLLADEVARLDLVLLGLGPDAHCASLFPGAPALAETRRRVVGVETAGMEPLVPRVTLTLPAINAAREVVFLVSGADKAAAVARAFAGQPGAEAPASLVAPIDGTLTVLLDAAAAAELPAESPR